MRLDTHCHLDAHAFDTDRDAVIARAQNIDIQAVVIPAVQAKNFERVRLLAHSFDQGFYALGIHPLCVKQACEQDLVFLKEMLTLHRHDPKLVAVGEIGLDFFISDISQGEPRKKQEYFYQSQLALACAFDLPVLLHVRRSQDIVLKYLRRSAVSGGIAHAFNGSMQQACQFIDQGFALGIGGAMTYSRAQQIRRLVVALPLSALVLETDSPDIAPAWCHDNRRNEPYQVGEIARTLATLKGMTECEILAGTAQTALRVLPRLAHLAVPITLNERNHTIR